MKTAEEVWNKLSYDQKTAATAVVFKHIKAHMGSSGTYRYLIYDRLGFGPDAYAVLMDGLYISNFIHDANASSKQSSACNVYEMVGDAYVCQGCGARFPRT